jgi:hypothetical protein
LPGQPATSTGVDSISETETDTYKHSKTQALPGFPRLHSERARESERARARERESYVFLSPPGSSRDKHRNTLKHRPYPHSPDSWQLPHPEEVSRGGCRLRGREEGRERAREREREGGSEGGSGEGGSEGGGGGREGGGEGGKERDRCELGGGGMI